MTLTLIAQLEKKADCSVDGVASLHHSISTTNQVDYSIRVGVNEVSQEC